MTIMQMLFLLVLAYLCGSFPSGKVYGRFFKGIDIQRHGSGNIGFANAYRVLGPKIAAWVLLTDVLKSLLPLVAAQQLLHAPQATLLAMGLAAIVGHAFPVWLRFKGGKSIATGLGVLLAVSPLLACCAAMVYVVLFSMTRISGISSVGGAWSLLVAAPLLDRQLVLYAMVLCLFATFTHRANIRSYIYERSTR